MLTNPLIGFLGIAAIAACWALSVVLFRVGTTDSVARKLSLLLFIEGYTLLTAGFPHAALGLAESFFEMHPVYMQFAFISHTIGDAAMLALYPPFLAAALQTKMTLPFANKRMQIVLLVVAIALVFAIQLSAWEIGAGLLYISLSLLFGFALIASVNAWLLATGAHRARARSFAYGILRTHLFDIDLKIRWTIKQSTLVTLVVTCMFLLSEGADRYLSSALGDFAGLLAAAVVVFFLAPLQRFAESIASAAMPKTQNTPEYIAFRKMQVYEEAVAEAHQEGGISEKERALLVRLRDSLGISESDAAAIEGAIAA